MDNEQEGIDMSLCHTLLSNFMPHWDAKQLAEYYKTREVTEEQMRGMAIFININQIGEAEAQKFLEGGEIDPNVIPKDFNARIAKMFPEMQLFPKDRFIEKLNKATDKCRNYNNEKYVFGWETARSPARGRYLYCDGYATHLTYKSIEDLWASLLKFTSAKKAEKHLVKYIAKRVISQLNDDF